MLLKINGERKSADIQVKITCSCFWSELKVTFLQDGVTSL